MFQNNDTITRIRFSGQSQKRDFIHQKRTVFGTVDHSTHEDGLPLNKYHEVEVNIGCFFLNKVSYFFDGKKKKDGVIEFANTNNTHVLSGGDYITLKSEPNNTYIIKDIESNSGVFGGVQMFKLTVLRSNERHST